MEKTNPHIEEYFARNEEDAQTKASRELFKGDDDDIDLRTELNGEEIYYINAMKMYDTVLNSHGLNSIFAKFYNTYFRLKVSKDRKSRGEFVSVTKADRSEEMTEGMKTAGTLFGGKK